jgi:hypothetical protein
MSSWLPSRSEAALALFASASASAMVRLLKAVASAANLVWSRSASARVRLR